MDTMRCVPERVGDAAHDATRRASQPVRAVLFTHAHMLKESSR